MADINSHLPVVDQADGTIGSAAPTTAIEVAGKDATGNLQTIKIDAQNGLLIAGEGTAGSNVGGVLSVQGIASGTAVPVSGTFFQATQPVSGTVTANAGTGTFAISAAALPLPAGASTSANQTNASQKTQVVDGSGNVVTSYNNQLSTDDIINTALSSGSITVSTSSVAARVDGSNLTNRKMLMIAPINGIVYLGSSSSVTIATGIPIYPNQVISFAFSANVTPYLIAGSSITVNVFEGA